MMLTTGMLMLGKMSVGVRLIASNPITRMRIASTTNVYGRRRANLTIHIFVLLRCYETFGCVLASSIPAHRVSNLQLSAQLMLLGHVARAFPIRRISMDWF